MLDQSWGNAGGGGVWQMNSGYILKVMVRMYGVRKRELSGMALRFLK